MEARSRPSGDCRAFAMANLVVWPKYIVPDDVVAVHVHVQEREICAGGIGAAVSHRTARRKCH